MAENNSRPENGVSEDTVGDAASTSREEDDVRPSLTSLVPDHEKPEILQQANLMQLLVDAVTYRSPLEDVEVILKCGAKVNNPVSRGLRPLHYAAYADYVECVRLLIARGADVNITDDIGYTPIHLCARKGNIVSMKILIDAGATVDFMTDSDDVDENTKTLGYLTVEPLNLAIENNHVDCLKLLLESGARPDHKYFMGHEINLVPLDHLMCLKILLQYGADPNVFNRCGVSPLMKACRQQNLPAARMLLKHGAIVDLQSPPRFDQKTALHFAVASGNAALVHVLLRHGASPRRREEYKYGALHTAVMCDRPDMCDMLFKWGAEVDGVTDECATPLMMACAMRPLSRQLEIVQLLLEKGADVNASSGYVTFTSPAYLSPIVEYLRHLESPRDVNIDILKLLIKYGAKMTFKRATTHARVKDPFGVLNYLGHVQDRDDVFHVLASNASAFDTDSIMFSHHLTPMQKILLIRMAKTPAPLRQLVRFMLRERLRPCLPTKVPCLPLPLVVKNYLLTG
ncbi:ankyrin-1-like [Littorina saxatilis]|uniref:SOCS box domain-containing protein n=1 Tax=Littorina saxatilis TaxID=31220 RepID=A0AAN9AWS3_9CAEN